MSETTGASDAPMGPSPDSDRNIRRVTGSPRPNRLHKSVSALLNSIAAERAERLRGREQSDPPHLGDEDIVEPQPSFSPFRAGLFGGLGLLTAYVVYQVMVSITGTLIVIFVAMVLAMALDRAVRRVQRWHLRRGPAVLIVFLALLGALFGVGYMVLPPVIREINDFIVKIPDYLEQLGQMQWVKDLDAKFGLLATLQDSDFVKHLGNNAVSSLVTVAGLVTDVFVVIVLAMFFLSALPRIQTGAIRLVPASRRRQVAHLGEQVVRQVGGYASGATIVALQAGVFAAVYAWIVGLPYPWAVGAGAMLLDFVPVVGPVVIGISLTLLGFTQSISLGVVTAIVYVVQHLFEAYWLYPRVMRRAVAVSTGAVVVALVIGGAVMGVIGALLAVPIAAMVQLVVRDVLVPIQDSR